MLAEAAAANQDAVDHFVFTRQVVKDYNVAQRIVLAELMWQVALADGALDNQESYVSGSWPACCNWNRHSSPRHGRRRSNKEPFRPTPG